MKSRLFFVALVCSLFVFSYDSLHAQRVVFWKGGTPGMESNWNCPKNWSNSRIPDAFTHVVIPDVSSKSRTYPVVDRKGSEINSLTMESGSALVILSTGSLEVFEDIVRVGSSSLDARGKLIMRGAISVVDYLPTTDFGFTLGK